MSCCGLEPTSEVEMIDQNGNRRMVHAASELPLTVVVDGQEIVTLMTMGSDPEKLVLGYLRNQRLIHRLEDIVSVVVDWEREIADVQTVSGEGVDALSIESRHRIVTTGCGQGTIYSCTLDKLYEHRLPKQWIRQSAIYAALAMVGRCNAVYRKAGSVHGCALIVDGEVLSSVEDVGRHNAMDTIAGDMWLEGMRGMDSLLYTTGRLTSEIVMKAAMMGIPALVSRNGVTHMAVELADDLGVMLIARAKSRNFQVFSCPDHLLLDAVKVTWRVSH
jgi:FdhD protein